VQATWNLYERAAGEALAAAHQAGLVVLVKEALANGRLSPRGGNERLAAVSASLGTSADALALAAVLGRPWADIVLIGAASVETLASNLAAVKVEWTEELERGLEPLTEPSDAYWRTRSELAWN
jgi:aryl-alcohol dehydrogenase-like predicted oxidoreductase